jgi:hypothetical protein
MRLRFAYSHTAGRQPFYGAVNAPGSGTGLFGVREKLNMLTGDDLKVFQEKVPSNSRISMRSSKQLKATGSTSSPKPCSPRATRVMTCNTSP